jgi:nitroreductase
MSEGMVSYYNNVSEYKEHLDITAAGTQLGMMMLQATELGYDSNGMIGIKKTELTRFLQTKKIINEYQTVNLALSIGHRDENHDKNKILTHNRIQKELLVKEFD